MIDQLGFCLSRSESSEFGPITFEVNNSLMSLLRLIVHNGVTIAVNNTSKFIDFLFFFGKFDILVSYQYNNHVVVLLSHSFLHNRTTSFHPLFLNLLLLRLLFFFFFFQFFFQKEKMGIIVYKSRNKTGAKTKPNTK